MLIALITPAEILRKHQLRRTSCREGILEAMLLERRALSEQEIRDQLQGHYDRTTFYRSFKTLEENRLLHKIVVDPTIVRYAIDPSVFENPEHAHFFCEKCQHVLCLDAIPVHNPALPAGFFIKESEFILKGVCKSCGES